MANNDGQTEGKQSLPASNEKCPCGKEDPDSLWVFCDTCSQWLHCNCVGLKGLKTAAVRTLKNWECPRCIVSPYTQGQSELEESPIKGELKTACDILKSVMRHELSAAVNVLKETVAEAAENAVCKATPSVVSGVVEQTQSQVAKSYAAAVDGQSTVKATQRVVEEVTRKIDSDKVERERRRLNVVVMKVPESQAISSGQRRADDMKFCYEQLLMERTEINKIWRAGKKDPDNSEYCRPLIIQLVDEETVDYWTDDGKGYLTESGHWVNKDLCEADRKANFLARSERRKRTGQKEKTPNH